MYRSWGKFSIYLSSPSFADVIDTDIRSFMREWFPKEVKAKQKENDDEIHQELVIQTQAGVVHPGNKDCLIM